MKNKFKYLIIGLIILTITSLITIIIDLTVTVNTGKPLFVIKKETNTNYQLYKGIFYNVYNCKNLDTVKIKNKLEKYECPKNNWKSFKIIDNITTCASALEKIHEDEKNIYYLKCIKSDSIYIEFDNGEKYSLKDVLEKNMVSIKELNENGLDLYIKNKDDITSSNTTTKNNTPSRTTNTTTIITTTKKEELSYEIIDYTGSCLSMLEEIYTDEEYTYYLPCAKSDLITIKFSNGTIYTLTEVIDKKLVSIYDLIENGLEVYKY